MSGSLSSSHTANCIYNTEYGFCFAQANNFTMFKTASMESVPKYAERKQIRLLENNGNSSCLLI